MDLHTQATRDIDASPEKVFAYASDIKELPAIWRGYGPIPSMVSARFENDGPVVPGLVRHIENSDGSKLQETIVAHVPPHEHAYVLGGKFAFPLSLMVREGHARWQIEPKGKGSAFVWTYRFVLTSPLAAPIMAPVVFFFRKAMERALAVIDDGARKMQ